MNHTPRSADGHQGGPAMPSAVPAVFADAIGHHRAGHWDVAARLYRQVLAIDPGHADSLHLLGVVAYQTGHADQAVVLIRQAIAINAGEASYHANLGNALRGQGRADEAVACYYQAVGLRPESVEVYNNLGAVLREQGKVEAAIDCLHTALRRRPDFCEAHLNLGNALKDQGQLDAASACYNKALELRPDYFEAHTNLGDVFREMGQLDAAVASLQRAIDIRPDCAEAHNNLGVARKQQGRLGEAVLCYRRAIDLRPAYPEAHNNLGIALLAQGDMAAGWPEYEWRWQAWQMRKAARVFACPQWRGEAAQGRTLLIHAEQGFGDTLQFCRYAPLAAARGLRVILEVPGPLVRLLRSLPGVDQVIEQGQTLPDFNLHCPMLSMPLAFGTTVATIPHAPSTLQADPAQVATWQARLAAMGQRGPRIGLVWAGSSRIHAPALAATDRRRSLPPERLAPLVEIPGLHFFSLQKDGPAAPDGFPLTDFMPEMRDFADTAALIATLDLVISVDTAIVHLAASLGKPVWMLDRFDHCWRWLPGRRDSPWYPTLLVTRQQRPGDWTPVLAEVADRLRGLATFAHR